MFNVLNKKECKVHSVGHFMGKLYYTNSFWGKAQTDIAKVIVISSTIKRPRDAWGAKEPIVTADIDIYTADGRVIEICTDDKTFLKVCDKYTVKKDPRAYYRQQR